MGSLAGANWSGILLAAATLLILSVLFIKQAPALNALLLGDAEAKHLGVPIQALKRRLILLTAVGVGVCVSLTGAIGFIGLVIPHLGRMLVGPDHRTLLPVSILLGALLLTVADMFARIAIIPAELPVGIVTALVGAPSSYICYLNKRTLYLMFSIENLSKKWPYKTLIKPTKSLCVQKLTLGSK